jgi:hypothetical protein
MKKTLAVASLCIAVAAMCCRGAAPSSPSGGANDSPVMKPSPHSALKTLQFSGYDWLVKASDGRVGPGPNYFSDNLDNVNVDAQGQLHLRITHRDGHWYCAEVISKQSFGYGTYRFHLKTIVDDLDPEVVLGMFTWNDDPAYNHREIDIEISRWGETNNQNAQFVVQPYKNLLNIYRFQIPNSLPASTYLFTWKPDQVSCRSTKVGTVSGSASGEVIEEHSFNKGVPQAGGENARINLWLRRGQPSAEGKEIEVIISRFEFVALQH